MLNVVVIAITLLSCTAVVRTAERARIRGELQWAADTIALASVHAPSASARRLADLLHISIVDVGPCGGDVCATVTDGRITATARASHG